MLAKGRGSAPPAPPCPSAQQGVCNATLPARNSRARSGFDRGPTADRPGGGCGQGGGVGFGVPASEQGTKQEGQ
eukprot:1157956-Pelagomonas_calceolata.AAC.4